MDLALNNLQTLICHKTQTNKKSKYAKTVLTSLKPHSERKDTAFFLVATCRHFQ